MLQTCIHVIYIVYAHNQSTRNCSGCPIYPNEPWTPCASLGVKRTTTMIKDKPFIAGDLVSNGYLKGIVNVVFENTRGEWSMLVGAKEFLFKVDMLQCSEYLCEGWYKIL